VCASSAVVSDQMGGLCEVRTWHCTQHHAVCGSSRAEYGRVVLL